MYEYYKAIKSVNADIIDLKKCFLPVTKNFSRGDTILMCSPNDDTVGIMVSGVAYLTTNNDNDQRRIFDFYQSGNAFSGKLIPYTGNKDFYITAKTSCTVDFIKYDKMIACCQNNCQRHIAVIDHFLTSISKKTLLHIDILGQKTLRSKILTFFGYLSKMRNSNSFTIPLPLSDMADYLSVDRSAMMRELKKLNDEQIIKSVRRKVTLLQDYSMVNRK